MSRWIVVLFLALALACQTSWMTTPAFAEDEVEVVDDSGGGATTDNTTETTDETPAATDDTTEPAATVPSKVFPTKAFIRTKAEEGKAAEAESAYLEWASYWQDDDPSLIIPVVRGSLMEAYRQGDNASLIALAQSGDREAISVLGAQVLTSSESWPPADLIPAVHFIGRNGGREAMNILRSMLYNEEASVVNATIEALGYTGDARIAPELMKMLDDADLERSVVLARTLAKLGYAKQVRARFEPQLRFPLPGVREKAALVLAAIGQQKGWPLVNHMLQTKEAPYYPLAVTVLGALPTQESQAYVLSALVGEESEQLAAMQSLNVLPTEKMEATLLMLMRDEERPVSVRVQAIRMLGDRKVERAAKDLRTLATKLDGGESALKGEAMMTLGKFGMLREFPMREVVRQRFSSEEEAVVRAARAVLLSFALSVK